MNKLIMAEWLSIDIDFGVSGSTIELIVVDENPECFTAEDPKVGNDSRITIQKESESDANDCVMNKLKIIKSRSGKNKAMTAIRYKLADSDYDKTEFLGLVRKELEIDKELIGFKKLIEEL